MGLTCTLSRNDLRLIGDQRDCNESGLPNKPASPTPNCGGRFARRRSLARAAVDVSAGSFGLDWGIVMRKLQAIVLVSLACLFSGDVLAVTGGEIYQGCYAAAQDNYDYNSLPPGGVVYVGHCIGLITGFVEMIRLYEGTEAPPVACIPKEVTVATHLDNVVHFLDKNRQHWDKSASVLVLISIKKNYLCSSQ